MTKNLKLDEKTARNLYKTATSELKTILEESFGKEFFNQKVTDRVSNFDDILKIAGTTYEQLLPWSNPVTKKKKSQNALAKIQLITEVYNENTVLDWNNRNQSKCYPYFEKNAGGRWVLCGVGDGLWFAYCPFGCYFKSKELCQDAVDKFIDIYLDYLPE